jgi:drug/metabolite transporter (DMT)-like permease
MSPHTKAIWQVLFVSLLWSTSWVLIKVGLAEIPALTFAGLRYSLASLCLLSIALAPVHRSSLRALTPRQWGELALLGLTLYAAAQGAQFVSLSFLPAASVSLVLSFIPMAVALLGWVLLQERLAPGQWLGMAVFAAGAGIYFYPASFPAEAVAGLVVAVVGLASTAVGSVIGRALARSATLSPVAITGTSMGMGSLLLLAVGLGTQGLPAIGWQSWGIIAWLAVVNTAFAFTLYNYTLQRLSAAESSVIINTMLIQIALLAWLFLGESLGVKELVGLALAVLGTILAQLLRRAPTPLEDRPQSGSA